MDAHTYLMLCYPGEMITQTWFIGAGDDSPFACPELEMSGWFINGIGTVVVEHFVDENSFDHYVRTKHPVVYGK